MRFATITLEQCLDLRHTVLWPHLPREASILEGDELARHFGIVVQGEVVSCLSVFQLEPHCCQIRKFATQGNLQRKGFGGFLFQSVLDILLQEGVTRIQLNARMTAVPFYLRFGFTYDGEPYQKNGRELVRMAREW